MLPNRVVRPRVAPMKGNTVPAGTTQRSPATTPVSSQPGIPAETPSQASPPVPTPKIAVIAVGLGLFGWLFTFLGSWIPSFWGDEAASIMAAERPLATLWPMLGRVDAVHGTYYLFLHVWIDLFGASELSVRFPSTVAAGFAVAGTVVLANLLFARTTFGGRPIGRSVAVISGLVCAFLPRMGYMAAEGRSYAIATALAVWLTVVFVGLVRRRTTRRTPWLVFSLLFAASIYVFLYLILLAMVYGAALLFSAGGRPLLRRWAVGAVCGIVLAGPVVAYSLGQHDQISFLAKRDSASLDKLFILQWFGNPSCSVLLWALIVVGILALIRHRQGSTVLLVSWLLGPMIMLYLGNAFIAPMYSIRYLSFCVPAIAIVSAVGIVFLASIALPPRFTAVPAGRWVRLPVQVVAVAGIFMLALPSNVYQRTPYAKDVGSDLRQLSAAVGANAHAGDAVIFNEGIRPSRRPRLALHLYPQGFVGLTDVALRSSYSDQAGLWDIVWPVSAIAGSLASYSTVWYIDLKSTTSTVNRTELGSLGFTLARTIPIHRSVVYEFVRENK